MCIESNFECVGAVSVIIRVDPKPVSARAKVRKIAKGAGMQGVASSHPGMQGGGAKRAKKAPKHHESLSFCDLSL